MFYYATLLAAQGKCTVQRDLSGRQVVGWDSGADDRFMNGFRFAYHEDPDGD